MEKEVFRIPMAYKDSQSMVLEFFICETNEVEPERDTRELGVVIYEGDVEKRKDKSSNSIQLDNSNDFNVEKIDALIKYLKKAKKHIKFFNENSKPVS